MDCEGLRAVFDCEIEGYTIEHDDLMGLGCGHFVSAGAADSNVDENLTFKAIVRFAPKSSLE